jgi:hypothetical protein
LRGYGCLWDDAASAYLIYSHSASIDWNKTEEKHLNGELIQLLVLQQTDLEIRRLQHELTSLPQQKAEIESRFNESVSEFLTLKQELESQQAEKARLESEMEAEQSRLEKFKADLMKATNEREYTTAVREIDVARKAISSFETDILKLMEKLEKLETQVKQRAPEIDVKRVEVDRQIADCETRVAGHQQNLQQLISEREPKLNALSHESRATYERVSRLRNGIVLTEARDWLCTSCRMKIRPQVFNEIRKGEAIFTCENCGRILYYKAEAVEVAG